MKLREEQITKKLLMWLENHSWKILAYDFPQSGTGIILHPNENIRDSKNKGGIIPDIIAIKDDVVVFFENKDHYDADDFNKIMMLREANDYSDSISKFLMDFKYSLILYGVGLPNTQTVKRKSVANIDKIDFALLVSEDYQVEIFHQVKSIFHL